jgi:hypothetical protein
LVQVQGKRSTKRAKFQKYHLSLLDPNSAGDSPWRRLTFRRKKGQSADRIADVVGCRVSAPKTKRQGGGEWQFRLDLAKPDNLGNTKFIFAADSKQQLDMWSRALMPPEPEPEL